MKIAIKRVQRQAVLGYAERAQFGAKLKTFRLFSMAALALAMAACSNEDSALENAAPAQQQGAMKFTATLAAPGSGATTRTTYTEVTSGADAGKINVAWKAGDQIYLFDEEEGQECTATVGTPAADGSATISGTFDFDVEAGDNITAVYPASSGATSFKSQGGTLAYIQDNLDYRIGTSTISVDGDQATSVTALEMESQIAIWKLTLQNSSSEALSATKVTIKKGSDVIAATTDITATSEVYLALNLATGNITGADITIEATVGSDTYTYSKSGVSLAKGKYYQSTVKMTKPAPAYTLLSAATTSDYGKVVCAAGHLHDAKTAVPTGCTAVGIVGKVTETGHGLILALKDAASQDWNTIDGWTSETTYAGTTLKVLPDDAARGNLTSYTTLGETAVSNWAVGQKNDYVAIFTNLGSTNSGTDGTTYDDNVNAYITTGVGGTALSDVIYWSATQYNLSKAWRFNNVDWSDYKKSNTREVRPVLGF